MEITRQWALIAASAGVLTVLAYTLLVVFSSGPFALLVILVSAFGPLLAAASLGLYHILSDAGASVIVQLAAAFNMLAAAVFTMMGLVQLAVRFQIRSGAEAAPLPEGVSGAFTGVWLGLDVAWDIFIGLGTLLFAAAMLGDLRFGAIVGAAGILVGLAVIVLNLWTFPTPPAEAGLFDVGPLVGLWYLAVSILVFRWGLSA